MERIVRHLLHCDRFGMSVALNTGVSSGVSWPILGGVGFGQPLDGRQLVRRGQMRIAARHGDGLVAHQLLDRAEIDTSHRQAASERVAEAMPGKILQADILDSRLEPPARP